MPPGTGGPLARSRSARPSSSRPFPRSSRPSFSRVRCSATSKSRGKRPPTRAVRPGRRCIAWNGPSGRAGRSYKSPHFRRPARARTRGQTRGRATGVLTGVRETLDWSMAQTFVAADRGDPWKAHLVGGSSDFDTFDPASGMWVFVRTPGTLTVAGLLPSRQAVQLTPGWNLVAFRGLATSPYTVGDLRAEVPVSRVEGYDPGGGYYLRLLSDAEELSFGFGYWG